MPRKVAGHGRGPRAFGAAAGSWATSSCARRGPGAQQRARVARVDDLLDAEALRGAERGADGVQPRLDLRAQRDRVLGGLELAPVGRLQPAGDRQRAPVARRPRVANEQPRGVGVRGARDAVDLAHEHRRPRHGRLVDGEQRAGAAAHRARALGLGADHEARLVDEVRHRQAELVAQVDEAHELVRGVAGQPAAVVLRIGGQHADRAAVEPRQRADQRAPVARAELEHRAAVEHRLEHAAHRVRLARVARDDRRAAPPRGGRPGRWRR